MLALPMNALKQGLQMAADPSALPEVSNILYTAALGIGTAIAAAFAYFKKPKETSAGTEVAVVSAALFSDKTLITQLVASLDRVADIVEEHTECVEKLTALLDKDIQHRHDEQIIRAALAKHGISHQG